MKHIGFGELVRTAPDILRGIGFSYGAADRASRMLVWGEAVHHLGLRFLRLHEDRIRSAAAKSFQWQAQETEAGPVTVIDAQGKCFLESGPRALDLSHGYAGSNGIGLTFVHNTFGLFLSGEIAHRSADRGVPTIVLYRTAGHGRDEFEATGLVVAIPSNSNTESIEKWWQSLAGDRAALALAVARNLLERQPDISAGQSSFAVLSVAPADRGHLSSSEFCLRAACEGGTEGWCAVADFKDRWQGALISGLSVETRDWDTVNTLIGRTRVPTSERSERQAGS